MTIYVIIPINDLNLKMMDDSVHWFSTDLRKNLVKDKLMVKFENIIPNYMSIYQQYNHKEILEIANGSEWSENAF